MPRGSSAYVEGVVDVSIVVPSCFENPLKEEAIEFLTSVLRQEVRAKVPVTCVLGAYHIATRYLRAPRKPVRDVLVGLLETYSPAFFPDVPPRLAVEALTYAADFSVESWDGYLVAVAEYLGISIIYSLDKELGVRVPSIKVVSPFSEDKVKEYHEYLSRLRGECTGSRGASVSSAH